MPTPEVHDGIVIVREFHAPRHLVFEAWRNPRHLMQWFAPRHCTTPYCAVDFRVGGHFHVCMRFSSGRDIWGIGVYEEIVEPERIVYRDYFADAGGNKVAPSHYGMSDAHPEVTVVTVTLEAVGNRTRLTLRQSVPSAVPERDGMLQGWTEMFDRLAVLETRK